jgi:DNA (cytosine-5)-methyltransferase 1
LIHGLALCSGIGGLELGVHMALGGRARTVCYVERDAYAAAVLLARMADSSLDRAPVWDDLTTFDAPRWRGAVDLVTAGFPCQPWSVAGKRKGITDERWLWPDIVRIVRDCEPSLVFLENVPGMYRHGLREVLSDLASLGFDAEWTCISAADIGAPHRRERVFILAHRDGGGLTRLGIAGLSGNGHASRGNDADGRDSAVGRRLKEYSGGQSEPGRGDVADAECEPAGSEACGDEAHREDSAGSAGGPRGSGLGFPPPPGDAAGWARWLAAGGPEPGLRRGPDGLPLRMDQLRALGNAVVPAQAAAAFQILLQR